MRPESTVSRPAGVGRWSMAVVAMVSICLCMFQGLVFADYKDSYRKGLDAVRLKNWGEVVRLMTEAISENPSEGERIRLDGSFVELYLPYFHIGLALARLGDCDAALRAWQRSEAQGAVRSTGHYKELSAGRTACEAAVRLRPPIPPPGGLLQVAPPAPQASERNTLQEAAQPEQPATPPPKPTEEAVTNSGREIGVGQPVEGRLEPKSQAPDEPTFLKEAAQAYRDGHYDKTLSLLDSMDLFLEPQALASRANGYLLVGAAKYALFRISGEKDAKLRRDAETAIRACRDADPAVIPETIDFPPDFVQFFRSVR